MNMSKEPLELTGVVLDETVTLTLVELCQAGNISPEYAIEMVSEGLLEPEDLTSSDWQFSETALKRMQTALRLQRDLSVNLAGAALALDLLEELEDLRKRLQTGR